MVSPRTTTCPRCSGGKVTTIQLPRHHEPSEPSTTQRAFRCLGCDTQWVDDDRFGQRLKAFVVPAKGKKPSEDDLKKHIKANLASYKVPRDFVFMEELPRNATGKILKRELAEAED